MSREYPIALMMALEGIDKIHTAVCLDPGASSGWCVLIDGRITSGQGAPEDAIAAVDYALGVRPDGTCDRKIDVLVIEEPYMVSMGDQWKLPWVGGGYQRAWRHQMTEQTALWVPKPSSWRAELGLNVGADGTRKRADVDNTVWRWCQSKTRLPLTTVTGKPQYDRCMAIGMLYAVLSIHRTTTALRATRA
jgi:hypothetical protein